MDYAGAAGVGVMPTRAPTHKPVAPKARKHGPSRQQTRALHTGTKAWRTLREEVLRRDLCTCWECGRYGDQVDHRDGNSHNNDMGNLQTLCISCHSSKTAKEGAMPVAKRIPSAQEMAERIEALEAKVSQLTEAATNHAEALDLIADQIEQPASGPKSLDD